MKNLEQDDPCLRRLLETSFWFYDFKCSSREVASKRPEHKASPGCLHQTPDALVVLFWCLSPPWSHNPFLIFNRLHVCTKWVILFVTEWPHLALQKDRPIKLGERSSSEPWHRSGLVLQGGCNTRHNCFMAIHGENCSKRPLMSLTPQVSSLPTWRQGTEGV